MKLPRQGRRVTLLVWLVVTIGLVAGIASNGYIGLTLYELNREQLRLFEQESRLGQTSQRLRQLGQEAQGIIRALLQLDFSPESADFPTAAFTTTFAEFRQASALPEKELLAAETEQAVARLQILWSEAVAWRERYAQVYTDSQQKQTLNQVRDQLQQLRAALESFEGRQRLQAAQQLRRWRRSSGEEAATLAETILTGQSRPWTRQLEEIKTELVDLSRVVEMLAGESQLDQLADLRDNQLKPGLERLEQQLTVLRAEGLLRAEELSLQAVEALKVALFGRGYAILKEYQTIRSGQGGLYQLARQRLELLREREALQATTLEAYQRLEAIHPRMTALLRERGQDLAEAAEGSLLRSSRNLLLLSFLTLGGFLGLGFLIARMARRQLEALGQLRRQNELILQSAGEGIIGFNRQGETIFINPAGARLLMAEDADLLGRDHREVLGQFCRSLAPLAGPIDPVARVLKSGTPCHGDDLVLPRLEGGGAFIEYTATPIRNEQGELEGAVLTLLDISDRHQAETALQHSYAELDELNRSLEAKVAERTALLEAKHHELLQTQGELVRKEQLAAIGSLAAGVAHEINNPAAIIRGNGEILLRKLPKDAPGREELGEILSSTERISRITQNLLIFAREELIQGEKLSLNQLLIEILAQAPHLAPMAQVRVIQELDETLPRLAADRLKLRQVFTNLIINALQAMGGEGTLTVVCRSAASGIEVQVRDTGPGIPAEIRSKIFNPFFTTRPTGTGLGLSVSYGIVQALGGEIEVVSEPGAGAMFRVWLPAGQQVAGGVEA